MPRIGIGSMWCQRVLYSTLFYFTVRRWESMQKFKSKEARKKRSQSENSGEQTFNSLKHFETTLAQLKSWGSGCVNGIGGGQVADSKNAELKTMRSIVYTATFFGELKLMCMSTMGGGVLWNLSEYCPITEWYQKWNKETIREYSTQ